MAHHLVRPLVAIMVQIQNQLQSDVERAQHLSIDWLIAGMVSVYFESQYNVGFLPGPACTVVIYANSKQDARRV